MTGPHQELFTRARWAVTLIEMLVALGVVALLLALTFPILAGARESSRIVACQANLREFHPPLLAYADDHRNQLPFAEVVFSAPYHWLAPLDALQPYIDIQIPSYDLAQRELHTGPPWLCPSDRDALGARHGLSYYYTPFQFMQISGAAITTRMYQDSPYMPVFIDDIAIHRTRNALLYNGSIVSK